MVRDAFRMEADRHLPLTLDALQGKVPLKDIRAIEIFMCSVVMRQGEL